MGEKKFHSAKRKRMINNTIVHIVLAVLAAIWIFPIIWVVLTSFRAEKGSYVSTFFPQSFTLDNYTRLFTDTSIFEFPENVWQHADHCGMLLYSGHFLCAGSLLLSVQTAVQAAKTLHEHGNDPGIVPWIYVYDRRVFYFKGDGADRGKSDPSGIDPGVFRRSGTGISDCKRIL